MLRNVSKANISKAKPRVYRSSEVARIANVSLRQLQWWDEERVIPVRHVGHARQYEEAELLQICVIAEMRRKGLSLQRIRRSLGRLKQSLAQSANIDRWLVLTARGLILGLADSVQEFSQIVISHPGSVIVVGIGGARLPKAA